MPDNAKYIQQLLSGWEQTFHKGQLTFWILLSLSQEPKSLEEITLFIKSNTGDVIFFDEQSIYRALRRYLDTDLISFELRNSLRGPQRKYYQLTPIGIELFNLFAKRNIKIFYTLYQSKILKLS
ncbi:MAG: hypothetical protein RIQ89_1686 [Bacteroidota bacterium]|jgi:PadR family transcriptional regulator, regulatory protein PadR